MLTLKKIKERNQSKKCNYKHLVYEHNHGEIIDCDDLGQKLSCGTNVIPDEWNNEEIKWVVRNDTALKIMGLRFKAWEKIMMILASEASFVNYKNNDAFKIKFYLIDNDGNKITKHPIL